MPPSMTSASNWVGFSSAGISVLVPWRFLETSSMLPFRGVYGLSSTLSIFLVDDCQTRIFTVGEKDDAVGGGDPAIFICTQSISLFTCVY